MKPVGGVSKSKCMKVLSSPVKNEMGSEGEIDATHNSLLDALRNTYISEKSSMVFRNATARMCVNQFPKVSIERQEIVDEFIQKFVKLSNEEQLLFYLRLPHSSNSVFNQNNESRLGILASRVEIRRTAAWIRSHLQIDNESSIPKRDVYDKYMEYCQYSRMIPISIADFGKVMKQLYPTVRPRRLGTRGQSQYCYSGMNSCRDLLRPNLYGQQPGCNALHDKCGSGFSVVGCQAKPTDLKIKSLECVNDRKCRNRKTILCHRSRWKRPFGRKDHTVDYMPDGPVEDEIAQYFDGNDEMICQPLNILKEVCYRPPSSFYRSLSYSGGHSEMSAPQSRCQSSISTNGSPWLPYESVVSSHNSTGSLNENHTLSQEVNGIRPQSCISKDGCSNNEESCNTHNCGFTPISPSPIPWRPFSALAHNSHIYSEESYRPRSFSSTDEKWAVPRIVPKQEVVATIDSDPCPPTEGNVTIIDNLEAINQKSAGNRSQSLPTFKEGNALIHQLPPNFGHDMDMTSNELSDIFDGSMVVENMCDVKIEEDFLPQLDNILESMKIPNDSADQSKDNFQMLTQDDMGELNISDESLRQNFEIFF